MNAKEVSATQFVKSERPCKHTDEAKTRVDRATKYSIEGGVGLRRMPDIRQPPRRRRRQSSSSTVGRFKCSGSKIELVCDDHAEERPWGVTRISSIRRKRRMYMY